MTSAVHGAVAPGFGPVREEFARNLRARGEVGAALAVVVEGQVVVDLWGGVRDLRSGAPWAEDTMVVVFSCTKAVAGLCLALLVDRGHLDPLRPVSRYWPEFGVAGKEDVTVRCLLSHQAGLAPIDRLGIAGPADLDRRRLAALLAAQAPAWTPGTRQGYHAWSLGWLMDELARRADPGGRGVPELLRDDLVAPLGLDLHIGLPPSVPDERLAPVVGLRSRVGLGRRLKDVYWPLAAALAAPRSLASRSMIDPRRILVPDAFNRREMLAIPMPGGNAVGTARSLATLFGAFAAGDERLGIGPAGLEAPSARPMPPALGGPDVVFRARIPLAFGMVRPGPRFRFGSSPGAFGHFGAGGAFVFADPGARMGYAYTPNQMRARIYDDARELPLRQAVYRALRAAA